VRTGSWVLAAVVGVADRLRALDRLVGPDPVGRGSTAPGFALPELAGPGELSLASLRGRSCS
jgi:hypothetical protein